MNQAKMLQVKGLKNVVSYSVWRNFGACSVLLNTKTVTDPIQKLFIDKLKDYAKQSQAQGGKMVGVTAEHQKMFDDTLQRIKVQFGADKEDFSKFPSFAFKDPELDSIDLEMKKKEK